MNAVAIYQSGFSNTSPIKKHLSALVQEIFCLKSMLGMIRFQLSDLASVIKPSAASKQTKS